MVVFFRRLATLGVRAACRGGPLVTIPLRSLSMVPVSVNSQSPNLISLLSSSQDLLSTVEDGMDEADPSSALSTTEAWNAIARATHIVLSWTGVTVGMASCECPNRSL